MDKIIKQVKHFFSKKKNLYMSLGIVITLVIVLIVALVTNNEKNKFTLDTIYDVYPASIRELYSNMVSVSCDGDLFLGISKDSGSVDVAGIDGNVLLSYALSYLEKNEMLGQKFSKEIINDATTRLFYGNIQLDKNINGFSNNGYVYNVEGDEIVREKVDCNGDKKYISNLFGYSYNKNEIDIDVNMGYLINDMLYDLDGNELGKYDGKVASLKEMFANSSYYTYTYVSEKKIYKLKNVEWKSRI